MVGIAASPSKPGLIASTLIRQMGGLDGCRPFKIAGVREPQITPDKIRKVAVLLRDKLRHGPPELRQAYAARLVMDEVSVSDGEIRISGSKSVLARCAAADEMPAAPAVLSFVREWRAGEDKNENFSRWAVLLKSKATV